MKFSSPLCFLMALVMGCSSMNMGRNPSSLRAPEYTIVEGNHGGPEVKTKRGDPNYVDPALVEEKVAEDVLRQMQEELKKLSSITMDDIGPAKLALPDYDVASKVQRVLMKNATVKYFKTLEEVKKEVVRTLSELLALKRMADDERDPRGLLHQQYELDVKKKIPALTIKINDLYSVALWDLTNLFGLARLPATPIKKLTAKDPFKITRTVDYTKGLYGICSTSLCLKKIQSDLEEWHIFARNFNNEVNFSEFNSGKSLWTKKGVDTKAHITIALIDAAQDILELGLKKNVDYSIAGVIAKGAADVAKTPAGIAVLFTAAPVFVFEKTAKVVADVLSFHVMKVELALHSLEMYKQDVVFAASRQNVKNFAPSLSNSAIYVHASDNKSNIIAEAFSTALTKGLVIAPDLMDFFSSEELVTFDAEKVMPLSVALSYLSKEKIQEIEGYLTADQKALVKISNYERDPQSLMGQSNDEIVSVLTKSQNPGAFISALNQNPELKKKILEMAPDLRGKFPDPRPNTHVHKSIRQILLAGHWALNGDVKYLIDFTLNGEKLVANFQWNGSRGEKRVKILDNDVYVDWNGDNNWHMKWTYKTDQTFAYTYQGGHAAEMRLLDTSDPLLLTQELVQGIWLYNDQINMQIKFKRVGNDLKMDALKWAHGKSESDLRVMIINEKVYIDWHKDRQWALVLTFIAKNKFGFSYQGDRDNNYIIRRIEE